MPKSQRRYEWVANWAPPSPLANLFLRSDTPTGEHPDAERLARPQDRALLRGYLRRGWMRERGEGDAAVTA